MTAAGFPTTNVLCAFTTPYSSGSASWEELNTRCLGFTCGYGRSDSEEICNPGEASISLDNTDGELDPDNTAGGWYGYIRPNRRVRLQVVISGTTYYLHSGYADQWTRTWPGGAVLSGTQLDSTDRMKLLAKRATALAGVQAQQQADVRMTNLLDDADVPSSAYSVNADGYPCRTLHAHTYSGGDALSNCQDVARAEGGQFFVDGQGKAQFQGTRHRTDNTRSTTSQATFGNSGGAGEIGVEADLDPTVSDMLMANRVIVTDYSSGVHVANDTTAQGIDGVLEHDLGSTLLVAADAPDRASDVLLLRKDPRPRYDSITVDLLTLSSSDQAKVLGLLISDRITLAITPLGGGTAMSRDQYIEGIGHDVDFVNPKWLVTFQVSGAYGGSRALPGSGTQTFSYNGTDGTDGSVQTFTVPAGITSVTVTLDGAEGGKSGTSHVLGGKGERVVTTLAVTPGESLNVRCGGSRAPSGFGFGSPGWNGGGTAGHGGAGGGGYSSVHRSATLLALAAGGGGGGDAASGDTTGAGGDGGGTTGAAGANGGSSYGLGGGGGTPSAGGAAGTPVDTSGTAGSSLLGGNGGHAAGTTNFGGGGGGGGLYGGGGGGEGGSSAFGGTAGQGAGGGGGGSGYSSGTGTTHTRGARSGHGQVVLTW